jgi:hypothetical protein
VVRVKQTYLREFYPSGEGGGVHEMGGHIQAGGKVSERRGAYIFHTL